MEPPDPSLFSRGEPSGLSVGKLAGICPSLPPELVGAVALLDASRPSFLLLVCFSVFPRGHLVHPLGESVRTDRW